jgi:hypothetical protein
MTSQGTASRGLKRPSAGDVRPPAPALPRINPFGPYDPHRAGVIIPLPPGASFGDLRNSPLGRASADGVDALGRPSIAYRRRTRFRYLCRGAWYCSDCCGEGHGTAPLESDWAAPGSPSSCGRRGHSATPQAVLSASRHGARDRLAFTAWPVVRGGQAPDCADCGVGDVSSSAAASWEPGRLGPGEGFWD